MKLLGFFTSPSAVVRSVTWLAAFLLLTVLWIMVLPLLSLDGLFQRLGNGGMSGIQSIAAITLAPPLLLSMLSWISLQVLTPPTVPAMAAPDAAPMQAAPAAVVTPLGEMLRIAAWSAVTPFGDAGATVTSSQGQEKIFRPDGAIRNQEGHPIHTAVVGGLPLEVLDYPVETRSRAMRVSAMLVTVLNSLYDQQMDLVRSAAAPATVYWLVPEALPLDNETRLCFSMAWTHSFWRGVDYDLLLLPAATENAYNVVHTLPQHMSKNKMPYVLLLAADSLLNPDELLAPIALDQVFSSKTADGFVPAEGAAGLLLADAGFAGNSNLVDLITLGSVHRGVRATDRGAKGKMDSSTLIASITEAMAAAGTTADKIGSVVSDTDHRFLRSAEVSQAMEQTLPGLDPLSDRISPMAFAGYFGAASDLIHMALAAEMVTATEQAVLAVTVADVRQTAALVIFPEAVRAA